MMINAKTWVLLANGARARVVKNLADKPPESIDFHIEQVKTSEAMADKAGRSFSSFGNRRAAMEPHANPVRQQERQFAKQLCDYLLTEYDQGKIGSLVVAASPRTLGDLRDSIEPRLTRIIELESNTDLMQLTLNEQKQYVLSLMRKDIVPR